jgi:heterodisulfide reductase subunit A-like polyferredoxin
LTVIVFHWLIKDLDLWMTKLHPMNNSAVLVVRAGIADMQAVLEIADSEHLVYLVEKLIWSPKTGQVVKKDHVTKNENLRGYWQ